MTQVEVDGRLGRRSEKAECTTILVTDDSPDVLLLTRMVLEEEGYEVFEAATERSVWNASETAAPT